MSKNTQVSLIDMVECIVASLRLANQSLHEHSVVSSRITYTICKSYGLTGIELRNTVICSLLHCVGTLITNFELQDKYLPSRVTKVYTRSIYKILSKCPRMDEISDIFLALIDEESNVAEISKIQANIVRLACNVSNRLDTNEAALFQREHIDNYVRNNLTLIRSDVRDAFYNTFSKDYHWLHMISPSNHISRDRMAILREHDTILNYSQACSFAKIIAYMIDFKSPNTINHSYGVAVTSSYLGVLCGLPEEECEKLKIAGYIHDIGKLGVPDHILYKPAKLTNFEFSHIKKHPYDTYRVLEKIKGLDEVRLWAAYHHEKPNGKGYPFNVNAQDLDIQCRILTIADVFSALREDRMYRKRFSKKRVITEMTKMFSDCDKDRYIIGLLVKNYEKIELARMVAEVDSYNHYAELIEACGVELEINLELIDEKSS